MDNTRIREIERVIDDYHKSHKAFTGTKEQMTYDLLTAYGDLCICTAMAMMLNPYATDGIVQNMDALNQAIYWINYSELPKGDSELSYKISEERYEECVSLLREYAYPYSTICSGYIAYSRKKLTAKVSENVVTFDIPEDDNNSSWNDILRERSEKNPEEFISAFNPIKISAAFEKLKPYVYLEDEELCYSISGDVLNAFLEVASEQWNATKTLPDDWKFDSFTLEEYRQTWIDLAALCYIHFCSLFTVKDSIERINNSVIRQTPEGIIKYITSVNGINESTIKRIVDYITYDSSKKNMDIMYQPLVRVSENTLLIAPMLFIGSNPERNLLSLVSLNNNDDTYSKEVNDLEDLMVKELEEMIPKDDKIIIRKHKQLGGRLPDIDLGIFDEHSNSVLLCELKWFMAADSSREVYAREDDINHGCEQQETVMAYALQDRAGFIKRVFEVDDTENVDIFCCVVAKHNIRTTNKHVPVIDIGTMKKLLADKPLNSVFNIIRNHEYEIKMPEDAIVTYKSVEYAGYQFKLPAICIGFELE